MPLTGSGESIRCVIGEAYMAKPAERVNTSVPWIASCQLRSVGCAESLNTNYANLANWDDFFGFVGRDGWRPRSRLSHRASRVGILREFRLGSCVGP